MLCRPADKSGDLSSSLPQHLKEAILVSIEAQEGIRGAAKMRLLSKSWRTAFADKGGNLANVTIQAKDSCHLKTVCGMLPDLLSLRIDNAQVDMDFTPISGLAQHTRLSLPAPLYSTPLAFKPQIRACSLPA